MAKSEQQRQRKLAKKKSQERLNQKAAAQRRQLLSSLTGKMTAASKFPIQVCYISSACVDGRGMGPVAIVRSLPLNQFVVVIFLIDSFCLGIKNVIASNRSQLQLEELMDGFRQHGTLETVTPGIARGYVEAAIAYARALGFSPHSDYRKVEPIWGSIEPEPIPEHYVFGQNGKPHFVAGPDDDDARQNMIFRSLRQTVGEGNFEFTVNTRGNSSFREDSLDWDEIDEADDEYDDDEYDDGDDEMTIDGTVTRHVDGRE